MSALSNVDGNLTPEIRRFSLLCNCGIRCRGCFCIVNREMSPNNRIPAKLDIVLLPLEVDSSTFVWFTAVIDVTEQATNLPRFSDLCVSSKSYAPSCFANETTRSGFRIWFVRASWINSPRETRPFNVPWLRYDDRDRWQSECWILSVSRDPAKSRISRCFPRECGERFRGRRTDDSKQKPVR